MDLHSIFEGVSLCVDLVNDAHDVELDEFTLRGIGDDDREIDHVEEDKTKECSGYEDVANWITERER